MSDYTSNHGNPTDGKMWSATPYTVAELCNKTCLNCLLSAVGAMGIVIQQHKLSLKQSQSIFSRSIISMFFAGGVHVTFANGVISARIRRRDTAVSVFF